MKPFGITFACLVAVIGILPVSAKPLTDQQVRDAAARIDSLLEADLKSADLKPTAIIDDGTFLRRAYLGIIGRIPTEVESRAFLTDPSPDKRWSLVDSLAASPGFDSHLFNWAGDLLRIQTNQEQFGLGWHVWLRKSLSEDKPWDVIVREMLSATGHAAKNPAVGYYLRDRNMQLDNFSNSMQVFLGRQIGCAQCHDHPFDDWTQHEYYQMAAFGGGFTYRSADSRDTIKRVTDDLIPTPTGFPNTREGKNALRKAMNERNREVGKYTRKLQPVLKDFNSNALFDDPKRFLKLPEDYKYSDAKPKEAVSAQTLFGQSLKDVAPDQRREAFANWVTSPENPYFTKVIANRLWARTFGHGLHDPIDDWNDDSKPAHPKVLAVLESSMRTVDYDLRQFSRILFQTRLFQRQCDPVEPQPGTPHLVRGPALQRMTAEQLYDTMLVLTRGEVDDSPLSANETRWENYTASIERLLQKDSHELIALGESATKAENDYRMGQIEIRKLRQLMAETKDPSDRKALSDKVRGLQQRTSEARKLRDPLASLTGEMSMMMEEGDGNRRGREGQAKNRARASELPAPFNPATLVREFGGSDRTTPSSGDTLPTVPQALALLNDPSTDIVGGKRSLLTQRLSPVKSPEERLDIVFIRLLSRFPDSQEKERFLPMTADDKSLRDLTRAMLTSNRFIFVQ
jgi:hypothetical protein